MPAKSAANAVWTIGHSTRSIEEFLNLLAEFRIQTVADVRSHPGSRKYPQYNQDTLAASLEAAGISYVWMKDLGGRRRARPDTVNIAWRNTSFRGYADYMESPQFDAAFAELEQLAARSRTALMCAEAVWWRCHRSMIADALCTDNVRVVHIMGDGHSVVHPMTSPARIVDGRLTYTMP